MNFICCDNVSRRKQVFLCYLDTFFLSILKIVFSTFISKNHFFYHHFSYFISVRAAQW